MNYWLYFLSIIALSQASILTRWSQSSIEVLGFWRLILATILLRFLFLKKDFFKTPKDIKVKLYILVSGVFLYLHFWTFFYAAQNTSIANTVILFCLNPLTTSIVAWIFLKDRLSLRTVLSFLFGLCAIIILFWPHLRGENDQLNNTFADFCALISALFYSVYVVIGKKGQMKEGVSSAQFSSLTFAVAALIFLLNVLVSMDDGAIIALSTKAIVSIVLLTLVPTLLGHALFLKLSTRLNINWMSAGKLMEPPLASLSAYFLFHQTPSVTAIGAFIFLVPSLIFLVLAKEKQHEA